ncbi:GNAT family N-acetyltransferase [Parendozoicomonas haliclonae]|uniref:Acetyltransferase (GNAT) family protein n=1 Tax=Parendozoicomonas haliclonae TaxID=1960125 RepID=A0A1X7AHL1_9GAMM|nr:N-acetyltransferase [Parendozoicomonas haliclonae]SMA43059.1 Acetyltransferase (GNAT) family protein [Parendozoicomonas haliclonae]
MKIRLESPADISAIETLTYQAFENHPHHEPGAKPTEHLIVNRLRESGNLTLSLIAEDETGVVGHIAFSPVAIAGKSSKWLGLGPVSVIPNRQKEGIGSQLINEGLAQLKEAGVEGIVLLGEPDYYQRFGFAQDERLTLAGVPPEYFLIKPLAVEPDAIPSGEVTYDPAFFE